MAGMASSASAATIVSVGSLPPANPYFYLTSGTPTSPVITANFGATIMGPSVTFDDVFEFTIPQNGVGSGSLSTSFSSPLNQLTLTNVMVDALTPSLTSSSGGQTLTVANVPIMNGVMNTIEVKGVTSSSNVAATYTGTATFARTAVPEPASWALLIGGFGLIGATMRRRRTDFQLA
jgi:hypothetical protein